MMNSALTIGTRDRRPLKWPKPPAETFLFGLRAGRSGQPRVCNPRWH
jgi:hypothetical protein